VNERHPLRCRGHPIQHYTDLDRLTYIAQTGGTAIRDALPEQHLRFVIVHLRDSTYALLLDPTSSWILEASYPFLASTSAK
jgi:hypothetical protein